MSDILIFSGFFSSVSLVVFLLLSVLGVIQDTCIPSTRTNWESLLVHTILLIIAVFPVIGIVFYLLLLEGSIEGWIENIFEKIEEKHDLKISKRTEKEGYENRGITKEDLQLYHMLNMEGKSKPENSFRNNSKELTTLFRSPEFIKREGAILSAAIKPYTQTIHEIYELTKNGMSNERAEEIRLDIINEIKSVVYKFGELELKVYEQSQAELKKRNQNRLEDTYAEDKKISVAKTTQESLDRLIKNLDND